VVPSRSDSRGGRLGQLYVSLSWSKMFGSWSSTVFFGLPELFWSCSDSMFFLGFLLGFWGPPFGLSCIFFPF
jgi:hypothetical protein